MSKLQLITMFCDIDDFCKRFASIFHRHLLQPGQGIRLRQPALALSEMMTLIVYFHCSHYRTFKHYYTDYVGPHLRPYFPTRVSYTRFVELTRALVPLCCYLHTRNGRGTGIAFIDSTPVGGLSQPPHCHARGVRRLGRPRQDVDGLVLRLQTPLDR